MTDLFHVWAHCHSKLYQIIYFVKSVKFVNFISQQIYYRRCTLLSHNDATVDRTVPWVLLNLRGMSFLANNFVLQLLVPNYNFYVYLILLSILLSSIYVILEAPLLRGTCISRVAAYLKLKYCRCLLSSITTQQRDVVFREARHNELRGGAYQLMGSIYNLRPPGTGWGRSDPPRIFLNDVCNVTAIDAKFDILLCAPILRLHTKVWKTFSKFLSYTDLSDRMPWHFWRI